jgi:broad specificity phosphatase PhoE
MKIYLVRHGRTNYNDLQLCNADPSVDVHLTPIGIRQAKTLAEKFRDVHLDHIFVSELPRTQQTATIVNKFHSLPLEIDARLNDIRTGFEGKPFAQYMQALDAAANRWTARFKDGESVEDIKKRVSDFIDELRTKKFDTAVMVTSQWIIQAIIAVADSLSNEDAWALNVKQGSCREITI